MVAKARHGWYDAVPVRVSASITPERPVKPLWPLLILAAGISLVAVAVVAISYRSLPDPMPTHYDAEGNVTSWKPKSWGSALLLPLISCGSTLLLVGLCVVLSRHQHTRFPDGRPKASRKFQEERKDFTACAGRTHFGLCDLNEYLGGRTCRSTHACRDLLDSLGTGGGQLAPGHLARHR
ncbi:DUF1648 domain-containing protein [Brevibacterium paucivorans]|uniref:DUF1648 domain-containing protein n=1 Tax=Brevibacterium paucivorans TaxID=170994 RepID=UPI003D2DA84D